jgi:hypothetical protein
MTIVAKASTTKAKRDDTPCPNARTANELLWELRWARRSNAAMDGVGIGAELLGDRWTRKLR